MSDLPPWTLRRELCSRLHRSVFRAALLAALLGLGSAHAVGETAERMLSRTLEHGGLQRSYLVRLPAALAAPGRTDPVPLVLVLHGGGGRAGAFAQFTGFDAAAEAGGFIAVFPDGVEGYWNDGRSRVGSRALVEDIDDVGFLMAIVDKLTTVAPVDPKRVYVAGMSNGGTMALRVACDAAERVAAVAAVAASLPERMRTRCNPAAPVSVLLMNGTGDPIMPWRGGEIRMGLQRMGRVLSTVDTVEFWVGRNGCATLPLIEELPDREPGDNSVVRRESYPQCRGAEVVLYSIDRGGHTWPGGPQYLPQVSVGRVNRDIDATAVIWDFFKRQSRE